MHSFARFRGFRNNAVWRQSQYDGEMKEIHITEIKAAFAFVGTKLANCWVKRWVQKNSGSLEKCALI